MHGDANSGCVLPLAQALITGVFVGLLAFGVCFYGGLRDAGLLAATIGAGAGALMWLASLAAWQSAVYPKPHAPTPEAVRYEIAEPPIVRVELHNEDNKQVRFIDLPATTDQLTELAKGLLGGATFSESQWTGAGGVFSRAEFATLRSEMIRRGLAAWNSPGTPARGASLTAAGRAAMRHLAGDAR